MNRAPRQVGLKTIFDLCKQKGALFSIGVIFTLLPFAFGAILLLVTTLVDSEVSEIDYENVNKNGKLTIGTLTDIETQSNVTINDEHPSIITYKYLNDNSEVIGKYRSLDPDKIGRMNIGDNLEIKYLGDNSFIVGLEPFELPFDIFLNILIPFLIIGITMLTILYLIVRNQISLYKYGEVKDAEIVSMTPKNGFGVSGIGQGVKVHYQYKTVQGQSILGESFTRDYTILNSKKQGDLVKVFVSIGNETKSCLIPKLDQIRNNWTID